LEFKNIVEKALEILGVTIPATEKIYELYTIEMGDETMDVQKLSIEQAPKIPDAQHKTVTPSGPSWTQEQLAAITTSGCNLLVAAAAGSGKTAVLVERIIRKITDTKNPVDIDRLLIVTFTNAAATEMRERIGDAISKALEENPQSKQLQKQLALLHKASITTIHSFCLEVIKNNFHCIDLDPNFRIADQTESLLLKMEALEELFEEKYDVLLEENTEGFREAFFQLVECYGGSTDDQALQEMVFTLHDFVQSSPWPEQWLRERVEDFNIPDDTDFGSTAWGKVLMENIKIELHGLLGILKRAINIIQSDEGLHPYLSNFQDDVRIICTLLEKCDGTWDALNDAFADCAFGRLSRCGKDVDKEKQENVKMMRDEVKNRLKKIKEDIFTSISREIIADLKKMYPLINCLSELVIEFERKYAAKKKEKSLLDFNDLEHFCLDILTESDSDGKLYPSKAALVYRERFEEILIDEYQDSNMVQEVIMRMISRTDTKVPNIFMVGDVKQSIYRFRQARPELFLDKYRRYSHEEGERERKIQLYKNFRSRQEVINSVNFIFKQIMSKSVGELDYSEEEALNLGAKYDVLGDSDGYSGGAVELHLLVMKDDESEATDSAAYASKKTENFVEDSESDEWISDEEEELDIIQAEARIVVKRIKELMLPDESEKVFKVYDKQLKTYRPVQYKDIVILLRATRNWADIFMEELGAQGIPAYADTGTGYFKTIEVQTVISLLQIIDNPMQDIPLLSVLRSPIVSFTPEELIDIRLVDRESSLYEAMKKLAAEENSETANKCTKFLNNLDRWRKKASYMSTDELIWYLYSDTGYFSFVGAMPGGTQRQANLRILFERARQYEATSYKGLFNFIHFINKLKSNQGDMGSAKILGENENVVRIMSIHKSKGLEFPVVFVSGTGKGFNLQDMNKKILLHQDLGFGPDFVDHKRRIFYSTAAKQALKFKIKTESLSEEMRVLYVAFTRAKEKLIITGAVRDLDKTIKRWCSSLEIDDERLPAYEILRGKNYLDWIGAALIRHKDCTLLRQIGGWEQQYSSILGKISPVTKDTSTGEDTLWQIKLWTKKDISNSTREAEQKEQDFLREIEALDAETVNSEYVQDIQRRLEWGYPYQMSAKLPTKMSVTELKRHFNTEFSDEYAVPVFVPTLVKRPMFLEETKGLTAAEKGTILHFVMQHLDLDRVTTVKDIELQIGAMVANELLTEQQAKSVNLYKVKSFFDSDLGIRLLKTYQSNHINGVKREVPFNIELECAALYRELDQDLYRGDTILIQGIIDCYFEEWGELVLIDYKTDYAANGTTNLIKDKYRIQIDYYAKALEKITGKSVKEKYIYLFWNGETIAY
jgi:ATP-dependent helicase/nuclease subunit A